MDFEGAVKYAKGEYDEQVKLKRFDLKQSYMIDISAMRAAGITPQPFD